MDSSSVLSTQLHRWNLTELSQEFRAHDYVKLPDLLDHQGFLLLRQEAASLQRFATRHDFVMEEYCTPRRLATIGGSTIAAHSPLLRSLYLLPELWRILEAIASTRLYRCRHPEEFMVLNYQDQTDDTHGWHFDDPAYALVVFLEAPAIGHGGLLEFIPRSLQAWTDLGNQSTSNVSAIVARCRKGGLIQSRHHEAGDAYLLRADRALHRTTELWGGQRRVVLNMAYEATPNPHYGSTATRLYGQG
ncbi:MAG TPA: hypothetical protein DCQ33_01465 [Nitrospira sp.]|nr:hypothetical protein [Nitrospira sp.]